MPTKKEINSQFKALTLSAFDFVERAILSFSENERVSLFLFATGIELFTKARLFHEHWSLIFANVDQAEFRRFSTGDLKTVSAEKCCERIKLIIGQTLPKSFDEIRKHRNRIAHFTHGTTPDERMDIISHQLRGWFDLHHLLRIEWDPIFKKYKAKCRRLEGLMRRHREFLAEKYKAIQPELKKEQDAGVTLGSCPACGYDSLAVEAYAGAIHHGSCRVCSRTDTYILHECFNGKCKHTVSFFVSDGAPVVCPECNTAFSDDLKEALDTDPASHDEVHLRVPINCPSCAELHSVVAHYDGYLCTECFDFDLRVGTCGWCLEQQLGGVEEHSELYGCEFCDGKIGRVTD